MRLILPVLIAGVALAGCYDRKEVKPKTAAEPQAAAVLGGVDLGQPVRALGTEPFWSVDIAGQTLRYSGVDRPEQTAPNAGPVMTGTVATWTARTAQGHALEISLMATECSDGMSDRTYPLTAKVEIGDETLTGCAAATAAIERAGESGRVE